MTEELPVHEPPDVDNPDRADEPDPAFDETDDETGETPELDDPAEEGAQS